MLRFIHFAQRTSVNRINRNISQNRQNLKTLRLLQFRLKAIVTLPKKCWSSSGFSCYSTLHRWIYAKYRSGLKLFLLKNHQVFMQKAI